MSNPFKTAVYKHGINPCVDIPWALSDAFAARGYIPVRGTLNGWPFRATLVPKGSGEYRLFLNAEMRKQAKVEVGDRVEIALELDPQDRTIPIPEALAKAFGQNPQAQVAFERLTPSRRKEILAYLGSLKGIEAIERNVKRVVEMLLHSR